MGMKCSQGELNAILTVILAHILEAKVIHDDVIVATRTMKRHIEVIEEIMKTLVAAGITLNPKSVSSL